MWQVKNLANLEKNVNHVIFILKDGFKKSILELQTL